MHLGNVFSALLSFLSAHSKGGKWVLRIEDLDPERSRKEYSEMLEDDLNWLGLVWDEGGSKGGDFGPYYQSQRAKIYQEAFDKLVESKVNEQIATAVKSAEVSLDAALTERMQKLVTKLDENAKINLVKVVNKLNENHQAEIADVKAKAVKRINEMRENANKAIATLKESYEVKAAQEAEEAARKAQEAEYNIEFIGQTGNHHEDDHQKSDQPNQNIC